MATFRSVLQGGLGGLVAGSALGLVEAVYHLVAQGAPDLRSPVYAILLYGLIGLPLGISGGAAAGLIGRTRDLGRYAEPLARSLGAAVALAPMLGFILFYLANKVVYAEQGVPLTGLVAIAGIVGLVLGWEVGFGTWVYAGPAKRWMNPLSTVGGWLLAVVVFAGLAALPLGDPRSGFAHGKPVPAGLVDRPNVLVIAVDTLRADYLGAYGRADDPTPVLDGIARDGVVFEDATAHASWTRSSFASLWTSRLPSAHNADTKASRLSDDLVLVSEVLQDAGVTTANLANNINVTATFNFDQGWDSFVYEAPAYHFGATESVFSLTFYKVVHKVREKLGGTKQVETFYQPAEVVLTDARAFIEANRQGRWMLGVHLMEPHDPYFEHPYLTPGGDPAEFNGVGFARAEVERPKPDQADYLKRVYLDEIRHMDRKLADFVRWLKDAGLYDDTLIVITSDHGEEFGEHGGFWHGTTLYEEQIHVPLIVKLPKNELAGERVAWQARLIDVAPTITAALGLSAPPTWTGRDLIGDVRSGVTARTTRAAAVSSARQTVDGLAESRDAGTLPPDQLALLVAAEAVLAEELAANDPCASYARADDRVALAEQDFEGNVLSAVKAGGFKFIQANAGNPRGLPETQLFDLRADRKELTDLQALASPICGLAPTERLEAMRTVLRLELEGAASGAVKSEDVQVDAAETCRLCALGYLDGAQCDDC